MIDAVLVGFCVGWGVCAAWAGCVSDSVWLLSLWLDLAFWCCRCCVVDCLRRVRVLGCFAI